MKILIFADVHGEYEKAAKVMDHVKTEGIDLILCPGDFTDMFAVPEGFSQLDIADMVLQKIMALKIPVLCVPGNHDPYDVLELFNEYNVNLHDKIKKIKGLDFIGWGGAPTPFNTIFEPSEEETKECLEKLHNKIKGEKFVLMVHNPPINTKLDMTFTRKHVGSEAIKEFIEKRQPIFAISAHIHEARGTDRIGDCTLFYPGALFEGYYGIVEIDEKKKQVIKCESRKIKI
ncbi:MAG: metallophosphoesterase [Candidatus Aenigmarchaeota archaeon]|nr:metallophosphoesterase [Candidatus Aenigmarchaeota archaeon]